MKRKILWTPLALGDLVAIREYIRQDNSSAAMREANRIRRAVFRLERFPLSGRQSVIPKVREVIAGNYRIFYRVVSSKVQILRIYHSKRNIQ